MKFVFLLFVVFLIPEAFADGITSNPPMYTKAEFIAKKCKPSILDKITNILNGWGANISAIPDQTKCMIQIEEMVARLGYYQECTPVPNLKFKEELKQVDAPKPLAIHTGEVVCEKTYFIDGGKAENQSRKVKNLINPDRTLEDHMPPISTDKRAWPLPEDPKHKEAK